MFSQFGATYPQFSCTLGFEWMIDDMYCDGDEDRIQNCDFSHCDDCGHGEMSGKSMHKPYAVSFIEPFRQSCLVISFVNLVRPSGPEIKIGTDVSLESETVQDYHWSQCQLIHGIFEASLKCPRRLASDNDKKCSFF